MLLPQLRKKQQLKLSFSNWNRDDTEGLGRYLCPLTTVLPFTDINTSLMCVRFTQRHQITYNKHTHIHTHLMTDVYSVHVSLHLQVVICQLVSCTQSKHWLNTLAITDITYLTALHTWTCIIHEDDVVRLLRGYSDHFFTCVWVCNLAR